MYILLYISHNIYIYKLYISSVSIYLLMHTDCFHVLVIVTSAAMNIGVRVSFQVKVFVFPRYRPRIGIAGVCCVALRLSRMSYQPLTYLLITGIGRLLAVPLFKLPEIRL